MSERNSVAGESESHPADAELRLLLQKAGLRVTTNRIAVVRFLTNSTSPQSHIEVLQCLPALSTDRSTVFRVLQDFVDSSLVRRMDLGDHVWRYELVRERSLAEVEHAHPHLLCGRCGAVTCLHADEIELRVADSLGAIQEVLVRGTCCKCLGGSLPTPKG